VKVHLGYGYNTAQLNYILLLRELRSSGLLRSKWWQFLYDVSGQHIGLVFKGEESKNKKQISFVSTFFLRQQIRFKEIVAKYIARVARVFFVFE